MKKILLNDYSTEINALEYAVQQKISNSLVSKINAEFKKDLEIKSDMLSMLLKTIESKLKRCQELYSVYFENIDHAALNGISLQPGKRLDFEVIDSLGQKNLSVILSDTAQYKELIQSNFEFFILTIASLYENLVFLSEMLLRKKIIHNKENAPKTMPLQLLIEYRSLLIKLEYQTADAFSSCIDNYAGYFDEFLVPIKELRNSFIHGFSNNIGSDGTKFIITYHKVRTFLGSSPKLELDMFTQEVTENTINFSRDLINCISTMIGTATTHIPA